MNPDLPNCYIDSSVISFLTGRPSADLRIAARQIITQDWWRVAASRSNLLISSLVVEEISGGDGVAAAKRRNVIQDIPLLVINEEIISLADRIQTGMHFPDQIRADCIHLACVLFYRIDLLVSWNFKHLVGPEIRRRFDRLVRSWNMPECNLCTPEEIMEEL